jgi:hypothetical protein
MKNVKKRILSAFLGGLCLLGSFSLLSCNFGGLSGEDAMDSEQGQTEETTAAFSFENRTLSTAACADRLKLIGRSAVIEEGVSADWSASGIEFNAKCRGEIKAEISSTNDSLFAVFVNGEKTREIAVAKGTRVYTLAEDLAEGEYYVRLLKQRAPYYLKEGLLNSINTINLNGDLLEPPADKEHYIEFIGDSIISGGGARWMESEGRYNTLPHALDAFSFLTAEKLDCDFSMVCTPGLSTCMTNLHVQMFYEFASPYRFPEVRYEPTRAADLVVIHLNANDVKAIPAQEYFFKDAVKELIRDVRKYHGDDVNIIWVYGVMIDVELCDKWTKEVFASMGGEEKHLYQLSVTPNRDGGNEHPSGEAHIAVSEILTKFIQEKNLLQ